MGLRLDVTFWISIDHQPQKVKTQGNKHIQL